MLAKASYPLSPEYVTSLFAVYLIAHPPTLYSFSVQQPKELLSTYLRFCNAFGEKNPQFTCNPE